MKRLTEPPSGKFKPIEIDHQFIEAAGWLLEGGIAASSGDCFLDDAIWLENCFSGKYAFSFLPKSAAQGIVYIVPISN